MTPTLQLAPLQLKEHRFTNIRVRAVEGGLLDAKPNLKPEIWFQPEPEKENRWMLVLNLTLTSADVAKPFAYDAELRIQGVVEVVAAFPEDKKEQLVLVNGFGMLYAATREMLLTITARSGSPVNLPSLSFIAMVAEALKLKTEEKNKPEKPEATDPVAK